MKVENILIPKTKEEIKRDLSKMSVFETYYFYRHLESDHVTKKDIYKDISFWKKLIFCFLDIRYTKAMSIFYILYFALFYLPSIIFNHSFPSSFLFPQQMFEVMIWGFFFVLVISFMFAFVFSTILLNRYSDFILKKIEDFI